MTEEEVKDLLREASEKVKEDFIPNMTNLLMDVFQHGINKGSELGMKVAADASKSKSQSLIKWQTGEPRKEGKYIVSLFDGRVMIDELYSYEYVEGSSSTIEFAWRCNFFDAVIAWCKLSEIKPYKEETK